ncbi:DUF5412 family protein [Desnuesiella massiliensis]|uniref:DUF5412 family protein n=1 Tax=Desnuesiella massiliensis TaxID=1650662 RepID=UPI0006E228E5|nr:DUF5412 family protein [Desnuesiella massiliensis]
MNVKALINRSGVIIYITIIVLAIIFNMLGFAIINTAVSNVFKVSYFILLIGAIMSFYKSEKKNSAALIFILLPVLLLFTGIPFKVVTMLIVCPLFFFKDINSLRKAAGILIYSIFITIGILGLLIKLEQFGSNTTIDQQYSSNKAYRTVTVDNDQGALGGNTLVDLEKIYFGTIKRPVKTLYYGRWGEKPKVLWLDENIVSIKGREMDIRTSEAWDTRK